MGLFIGLSNQFVISNPTNFSADQFSPFADHFPAVADFIFQ
jgi:hypothetical protein